MPVSRRSMLRLRDRLQHTSREVAPMVVTYRNCTVASITAGATTDGTTPVSITVGPDTVLVPYLASYGSPSVGDMVRVQFVNGSPLILGRVQGLPNF